MFEALASAFTAVTDPIYLLALLSGVLIGIVVGILPGIGGMVAMSVVLPFIFRLDNPPAALAMIIGAGAVCVTSDSITAILFGVPGTVAGAATIVDGYAMAKKGEAGRALGAAFTASLIGGVFGALCLTISLPVARPLILLMGSPEFFMMALLGVVSMATLGGQSPIKGTIAAGIGMMLSCVGGAPGAMIYRYTLDIPYLFNGIPLIPVAMGLFAIPEMADLLIRGTRIAEMPPLTGLGTGVRDALKNIGVILKGAVIGAYVGIIPGMGGSVANWFSYGYAVSSAKDKSQFGKGDIRGLLGPESANNACVGGDMIPTILFGVPGGPMMAILLAAFLVVGIYPGREMVTTHLDLTISMIWSLALANLLAALICMAFVRPLSRITNIPIHYLAPCMLMVIILGGFQTTRHWGDLIVILVCGIIGWYMKRFRFPRPSLLVGFVLGQICEQYLYLSIQRYNYEFLWRPGVIVIALLTLFTVYWALFRMKPEAAEEAED
jgi:putative tricarboxylic transport membrane protein